MNVMEFCIIIPCNVVMLNNYPLYLTLFKEQFNTMVFLRTLNSSYFHGSSYS